MGRDITAPASRGQTTGAFEEGSSRPGHAATRVKKIDANTSSVQPAQDRVRPGRELDMRRAGRLGGASYGFVGTSGRGMIGGAAGNPFESFAIFPIMSWMA